MTMNDNLPEMDTFYRNLHRARAGATRTIGVLKKVAPNPTATPPETTTSFRSRRLHTEAAARPTSRPVRTMIS